jgi:hypothetical protein
MAEKTINNNFYTITPGIPTMQDRYELRYDPVTSNTTLYKYVYDTVTGVVGTKSKVYEDGVWKIIASLNGQQKIDVHQKIKDEISKLKGVPGNKMPAFVTQNAPSLDEGMSGQPTLSQTNGAINSLFGALSSVPNTDDYGSSKLKTLFKNGPLKYPIDIMKNEQGGQDVLVITQYKYRPPYYDVIENSEKNKTIERIFQLGAQRTSALREKIQDLYLPIPNNVSDSNAAGWGQDVMNTSTMGAAGDMGTVYALYANKMFQAGLNGIVPQDLMNKITARYPALAAINNVSKLLASNPDLAIFLKNGGLNNPALKKTIDALVMKQVGFDVSIDSILSRGYGVVSNSNLELLFNGPTLRGFTFGYNLSPRSEEEAKMCRNILRFFKQGMAPKKTQKLTPGYGSPSFLLSTPNVFKLRYRTWDNKTKKYKDIAGLNKFKICALTNMQTSYSEGAWAAYEEGQPARMQMNLTFKELEPVYESDYQDTVYPDFKTALNANGLTDKDGYDQDPVLDDEIGY